MICDDNISDNITDSRDRPAQSLSCQVDAHVLPQLAGVDIMVSAGRSRWNVVNTETKTLDLGLWGDPTRFSWLPLSCFCCRRGSLSWVLKPVLLAGALACPEPASSGIALLQVVQVCMIEWARDEDSTEHSASSPE